MTDGEKFNLIKSGKVNNKFGLPDLMDMFDAYFPCEFVEVIDELNMIIKIYETSIKKYHITGVSGLTIE